MKASEVATQLGLTRGATTTALDRLEDVGLVVRRPDAADGRSVIIELTPEGKKKVVALWAPMRKKGGEHLRSYSARELVLLRQFFERSLELQRACTELLRLESEPPPKRTRGKRPHG